MNLAARSAINIAIFLLAIFGLIFSAEPELFGGKPYLLGQVLLGICSVVLLARSIHKLDSDWL